MDKWKYGLRLEIQFIQQFQIGTGCSTKYSFRDYKISTFWWISWCFRSFLRLSVLRVTFKIPNIFVYFILGQVNTINYFYVKIIIINKRPCSKSSTGRWLIKRNLFSDSVVSLFRFKVNVTGLGKQSLRWAWCTHHVKVLIEQGTEFSLPSPILQLIHILHQRRLRYEQIVLHGHCGTSSDFVCRSTGPVN